jgi:hypothetical protein
MKPAYPENIVAIVYTGIGGAVRLGQWALGGPSKSGAGLGDDSAAAAARAADAAVCEGAAAAGRLPEGGMPAPPFGGGDPFDPRWIRWNPPGSKGPGTIIGPKPPGPESPWPWWLLPPGTGHG